MASDSAAAARREAQPLVGGRYRIQELLGRGGMGSVHAALDVASGRRVALKRLIHSSPRVLELFKREWTTLHGLRHAHIIEVYDFGQDEGGAFYTMELLEGRDLGASAPMHWREVCACLRDVASILGVLHARRLLHRDLSPKNLWRLPNGQLKLIDFGALAPFGSPTEIVGTPPFIPPEALRDSLYARPLDQRADLYALGALGYFLLTGVHAYPAKTLAELPRCWEHPPSPVSSRSRGPEPVPAELEALLGSLLRFDPDGRLASTDALIDRLQTVPGLSSEARDAAVQGYLHSKAFVGRRAERARVEELLAKAAGGQPQAVLIEAEAGMGRTRLLDELSMAGRLAGAIILSTAAIPGRAYAVANRLALALLDALPEEATRAAQPHAAVLAHLSSELRERLACPAPKRFADTTEARLSLQATLSQWFGELAEDRLLVLLVDDLQHCDEESSAWLSASALDPPRARLLLVATLKRELTAEVEPRLRVFAHAAVRMRLAPLSAVETHALLRSVFGDVPYLESLTQRVHRKAAGQPAYTLQLAEHLIETDVARYADGAWSLPLQIEAAQLPDSPADAHLARLTRISSEARALAQLLSVQDSRFSRAQCMHCSELDPHATERALVELTLGGVLIEDEHGYHFCHTGQRDALYTELDRARRARAEQRLGELMLRRASGAPVETLRAALHIFRAGEQHRAQTLVRDAVSRVIVIGDPAMLANVCPVLEQVVALYRAAGCDDYAMAAPLALLGFAGWAIDHRLAKLYGEAAIAVPESLLRFDLARRLARALGAKLALLVALSVAAVDLTRRRSYSLRIDELLRALVTNATALNGVAVSFRDPQAAQRCRDAMEPLACLGPNNIAGFMQRSVVAAGKLLSDHHAAALAALGAQVRRLEDPAPLTALPERLRTEVLASHLLSFAILECWRESSAVPALADRMTVFGPIHAICADRLRTSYYAARGELSHADYYRRKIDAQAVALGAAWQFVTWGPVDAQLTALWTRDAMLAKRASRELSRLATEWPSLASEARWARATYLALRGRHAEVVALLEPDAQAPLAVGSTRALGLLARAYNALSQHARARDVCAHALAQLTAEDLAFVLMTLHAQLELAHAEAGLGDFDAALARLGALSRAHRQAGPLTRGALHEASARVALARRDFVLARSHIERLARCYRKTAVAALIDVSDGLAHELERAERRGRDSDAAPELPPASDERCTSELERVLADTSPEFRQLAASVLAGAIERSQADTGILTITAASGCPRSYTAGKRAEPELLAWAEQRLSPGDDEETLAEDSDSDELGIKRTGDATYCFVRLWTGLDYAHLGAAALVLGWYGEHARFPDPDLVRELESQLLEATTRAAAHSLGGGS